MKALKLLGATMVFVALPAWAGSSFLTGVQLHSLLEAQQRSLSNRGSPGDDMDALHAAGYITGVTDALDGVKFCTPDHTTYKQLAAIVMKYLNDHPAEWQYKADNEIAFALIEAFPCQKQN